MSEEVKKRNENSLANLKPFDKMTVEERKAMGKKGGTNSGISKRKKRDIRELAKALLETSYNVAKAREIVGEDSELIELLENDTTVANVLNIRMMQEAKNGNVKAFETLRDTAGYKPSESIQLDANVMTENDKELLDKVAKRNGINPEN